MELRDEELTGAIIEAAIAVHKQLGPGFLESIYQKALEIELTKRGIPYEAQKRVTVRYDGQAVGEHVLDLLVYSRIVVELKAVKSIETVHYAVVRSYLTAADCRDGLILNFAKATIDPKRVARDRRN